MCIGLLILTPLFTADLTDQQNAAELAGTRLILDSPLDIGKKLALGTALVDQITSGSVTRPPDIGPAFDRIGDVPGKAALESAIQDQIDRAVTHAFSRSFAVAALLALAAAIPLLRGRPEL